MGQKGNIVAIGHSGEDGILTPLRPYGTSHRSIYGMILDLGDSVELKGGILLHSNEVQYPVALASDPSSDDLYVAEIFSDDNPNEIQLNVDSKNPMSRGGTDLSTTGYNSPLFGMRFSVRLQKLSRAGAT
jgi:hypothetical protein